LIVIAVLGGIFTGLVAMERAVTGRLFATAQDIVYIGPDELKERLDGRGDTLVIDTRSKASYEGGHIPGALWMPLQEIPQRYTELPRFREKVFYCSCWDDGASVAAAQLLQEKGLMNSKVLRDGYTGWEKAGYPIEAGDKVPRRAFWDTLKNRLEDLWGGVLFLIGR